MRTPPPLGTSPTLKLRMLVAAAVLSNVADGMLLALGPLLVAGPLEGSPVEVASVVAISWLPPAVASLPGGRWIDRVTSRTALAVMQMLRAALFGIVLLLVNSGTPTIALIALVLFLAGAAESVFDNALQVAIARHLRAERLARAYGQLGSAEVLANRFVGPTIGSLLFATSIDLAFALLPALYAASLGVVFLTRGFGRNRLTPGNKTTHPAPRTRETLRIPAIRHLLGLRAALSVSVGLTSGILVLFVTDRLALGSEAFGPLIASNAIGGAIGGLVVERVRKRWGTRTALLTLYGVIAMAQLAFGLSRGFSGSFIAGLVFGFAVVSYGSFAVALRQRLVSEEQRGFIGGIFRLVTSLGVPLGAVVGGAVANFHGLRAPFVLGAGIQLIAVAVSARTFPHGTEALSDPHPTK